jgi:hypothetical protein
VASAPGANRWALPSQESNIILGILSGTKSGIQPIILAVRNSYACANDLSTEWSTKYPPSAPYFFPYHFHKRHSNGRPHTEITRGSTPRRQAISATEYGSFYSFLGHDFFRFAGGFRVAKRHVRLARNVAVNGSRQLVAFWHAFVIPDVDTRSCAGT